MSKTRSKLINFLNGVKMKTLKSILAAVMCTVLFIGIATAETKTGKDLFLGGKCNTCHSITSQEITTKGKAPDLSEVGKKGLKDEFLTKYLNKEEKLNDKPHPVKFKGEAEDFQILVTWLNSLGK